MLSNETIKTAIEALEFQRKHFDRTRLQHPQRVTDFYLDRVDLALTELRQQPAMEYERVPDGMHHAKSDRGLDYEIDGDWLRTYYKGATGWGCRLPTELDWQLWRPRQVSPNE